MATKGAVKKKAPAKKKATQKKKPTPQGRIIAKSLLEGKTQKQALIDAGFSAVTAEHESKRTVVNSGALDLIEKYLPDELLLKVHMEGLEATKQISGVKTSGGAKEADGGSLEFVDVPDHPTRKGFLDIGYRLKGKYPDQKFRAELETPSGTFRVVLGYPEGQDES